MDHREVFTDSELADEFLDRFDDIKEKVTAQRPESTGATLASLDVSRVGVSLDTAATAVAAMKEGTYEPGDAELEAIIERFTRPVYLIQDSTFTEPGDDFDNSEKIAARLEGARANLDAIIPSVGRIDLRNSRGPWAGTGWVVAPDVVATNRHVAEVFARADGAGFSFRKNMGAPDVRATLDWRHEYNRSTESLFRVKEIIWMEPEDSFDVALLRVTHEGQDDEPQPSPIPLLDEAELQLGMWVGVVGYPARSPYNDAADQQRIFDGIYDVKRLAPGKVNELRPDGNLSHDATTLGGNSGSAVVDLDSGGVAAIHFGGIQGETNSAVQAPQIAEIVKQHAT